MSPRSIRARLTTAFVLCTAAIMALSCGSLFLYAYNNARQDDDRALHAAAVQIEAEWKHGNNRGELWRVLQENSTELGAENIAAAIYDPRGALQHAVPDTAHHRAIPPFLPIGTRDSSSGDWRTIVLPMNQDILVLGVYWAENDAIPLRGQAIALGLLSVIVVSVVSVGAWQTVGRTLLPIAHLSRQAQEAARGAQRRPVSSPIPHLSSPSNDREITELVSTLNTLLTRETEVLASRGRFYAAASHELRTPLQALSGHLELALSRPHRSETEYRAALEESLSQTRRLTALARDLLLLHRLEGDTAASAAKTAATTGLSSPITPPLEPVDLSDLCARTMAQLQADARAYGVHCELDLAEEAIITAPPNHASILVRNLIDNAVRYANENGTVRVTTRSASDTGTGAVALLNVFNTFDAGIPLPLDELQEPFHRPDPSRTERGNGLGLAICRAITAADGWTFTLTQDDTGGVHATVIFPLSPPA